MCLFFETNYLILFRFFAVSMVSQASQLMQTLAVLDLL